jgi:hypothetical protein
MGARAVDWARLESVCTARYRGFESLPIRQMLSWKAQFCGAPKVLYIRSDSLSMLAFMKWKRTSWFLALVAVAMALVLTSCMNQEGVGPAEGELKGGSSSGY